MIFSRILPFFLLSLTLAFDTFDDLDDFDDFEDLETREHANPHCPKGVHIFHVRGNGGVEQQGYGITLPLINAIKKAVPHSTNHSIRYPKTTTSFINQNTIAVHHEHLRIRNYIKKCPKTAMVLTGYSEGAMITMNTVCGTSSKYFTPTRPLPAKYTKNIIAVIAYSDPGRTPKAGFNRGGCKNVGTFERLSPAGCDPYADRIRAWCHAEDDFCCTGGDDHHTHYTYFKDYDKYVGKFVAHRYAKFKADMAAEES